MLMGCSARWASPLGVGFFHRPREEGAPLVYDLMEEFRALIEVRVALQLGGDHSL